jgi:Trypsin-like peptidase domain
MMKLLTIFLAFFSWRCFATMIDPMSVRSLYLFEPLPSSTNGLGLTGTGFIVANKGTNYLITNWHVLSGRDWPNTNSKDPKGSFPTNVVIFFNSKVLGKWISISEPLYDTNGVPLWLEDKTGGTNIDVVALPLTFHDDRVQIYPLDLDMANVDMRLLPAMSVSIIGFPNNLSNPGEFPIWKTGNIATDPDIDYKDKPIILAGVFVQKGMSGSPVIARAMGSYMDKSGNRIMTVDNTDDFIGIFSAYQMDNEIAIIWKARVISEILENGKRGTLITKQ